MDGDAREAQIMQHLKDIADGKCPAGTIVVLPPGWTVNGTDGEDGQFLLIEPVPLDWVDRIGSVRRDVVGGVVLGFGAWLVMIALDALARVFG